MSILPILVATALGMGLGALWYSPKVFGPAWMMALGKSAEDLGRPGPAMAGSILACVVSACAVEYLVVATGATSPAGGLAIGAVAGLALVAPALLSDALFSGWGWRLYLIQAGYRVSYLLLMGLVCGAWPR